jgi:hypothetical protein
VGIHGNRFPKLKSFGADFLVFLQSFMSINEHLKAHWCSPIEIPGRKAKYLGAHDQKITV